MLQEFWEKTKHEKVMYPVMPPGTPAVPLDRIVTELGIGILQMDQVLNKNPDLRKRIKQSGFSGGKRAVEEESVKGFMDDVRDTGEYRRYVAKNQAKTHAPQERPGDEEIILGTPSDGKLSTVHGKMSKKV